MKKYRISLLFLPMAIVLINIYLKESEMEETLELTDKLVEVMEEEFVKQRFSLHYGTMQRQPQLVDSIFTGKLFDEVSGIFKLLRNDEMANEMKESAVNESMEEFVEMFQANVDPRILELFPRHYEFIACKYPVGSYATWQDLRLTCALMLLYENAVLDIDMSPTNYCENRVSTRLTINKGNERILEVEPCANYKNDLYAIQIGNYKDSFKNSFKIEIPIKEMENTDRIISITKIREGEISGVDDTLHLKYKVK